MSNQDAFDATQRVYLDGDGHPTTPPKPQQRPRPPRPTPSQRAAKKRRQQRITLISLCAAALVLLIVLIVILANALTQTNVDNGKILNNVYAAGINLGGMTPEEAKAALHTATDNSYSKVDMTVTLELNGSEQNPTLTLSPEKTGAKLNVDAVVEAAYALGRTGSRSEQQQAQKKAQTTGHTIPVVTHLSLDSTYIQSQVDALGTQYSTLLKESTYTFTGARPSLNQDTYDTTVPYQTLIINIGTAEYSLNTEDLYEQILAAYDTNIFEVTYNCTVKRPAALDCLAIYTEAGCCDPIDATYDDQTHEITEEVYGYGFTLEQLQAAVNSANYGDEIRIDLYLRAPTYTADYFRGEVFQDTLSYLATALSSDNAWNINLRLACEKLNGTTLNSGEEFSFNAVIGEPSIRNGYKATGIYLGKSYQQVVGGGISQIASMLYYCALKADLEIVERNSHSFTVDFIQAGFDAEVYYDAMDLRFRNTTDAPIRIDAEIVGSELRITFVGTDSKDYTVDLSFKIDETYEPGTVINTMQPYNPGGYVGGEILREGIAGCLVSTYITRSNKSTGKTISEDLIAQTYYAKQDQVIVEIYTAPVEPVDPPVDPGTDPENPGTDPENPGTDPENPGTDPENPGTDPENPGTDPENPGTDPVDPGTDPVDPGTDPGTDTGTEA